VRKADRPIELPAPRHLRAAAFDVGREAGHLHKARLAVIDFAQVVPFLLDVMPLVEFLVVEAEMMAFVHLPSPGKGIEHRSSPNRDGSNYFS